MKTVSILYVRNSLLTVANPYTWFRFEDKKKMIQCSWTDSDLQMAI